LTIVDVDDRGRVAGGFGITLTDLAGDVVAIARQSPSTHHGPTLTLEPLSVAHATELFRRRANAVVTVPDDAATVDQIASILDELDGWPLAIELAAARLPSMPIPVLADRLTRLGATDTDLAGDMHGNVATRDSRLTTTVRWSIGLLEPFDYAVWCASSVFESAWSVGALVEVTDAAPSDVGAVVERLVTVGLLQRIATGQRYRIPTGARRVALDRLLRSGLAGRTRDRHLAWTMAASEDAANRPVAGGVDAVPSTDELEGAIEWAIAVADATAAATLAITGAAVLRRHERVDDAERLLQRVRAAQVEDALLARVELALAATALQRGDLDAAHDHAEAAHAQAVIAADHSCIAFADCALGRVARSSGDLVSARRHLDRAATAFESVDDPSGIGTTLRELGLLSLAEGEFDVSTSLLEAGLEQLTTAGDGHVAPFGGRSMLLHDLGVVEHRRGDLDRARRFVLEALQLTREHANDAGARAALTTAAWLAARASHIDEAAQLLGASRRDDPELEAALRLRLGSERLSELLGEARALDLTAALDLAESSLRAALDDAPPTKARKAFLFTDIVESTQLIELLGDDRWNEVLAAHDRAARRAFAVHNGVEVKSTGDGFLAVFDRSDAAIECAATIQSAVETLRAELEVALHVRAGIHAAEAFVLASDFAGRGVHLAARIAAQAAPDDILVTDTTAAELDAATRALLVDERSYELKGIAERAIAWRVEWQLQRASAQWEVDDDVSDLPP
jgi:class 3 adenylate cyclase